jgi:3-keto-5-aminohexanoate cleavage enzyme
MTIKPLIITATPNISWLHPEIRYPRSLEEFVEEAKQSAKEGASIIHVHAEGTWGKYIYTLKREMSVIVQCGMSSLDISERMEVFTHRADMISVILGHHDEAFVNVQTHKLHTREELEEYMRLSEKYGVKPEFEVWHLGHVWNLRYLIGKNLVSMPYFATLFFNWPGGNWTPATVQEYNYRKSMMPPNGVFSVSVMGDEMKEILVHAVLEGDHVRVGTEDHPFIDGRPATTHELVAWIRDIAKDLGRKVASPDEAKAIIRGEF